MKQNRRKTDFLAMDYGKASHRLKKQFYFSILKKFNLNHCFRCNKEILTEIELSLDHKEPWFNVSVEKFWDLNNLAFSHLKCNTGARRSTKKLICPKGHIKKEYEGNRARCLECGNNLWHINNYAENRKKKRRELKVERNTKILHLNYEGKSVALIAKELNIGDNTVRRVLKAHKVNSNRVDSKSTNPCANQGAPAILI